MLSLLAQIRGIKSIFKYTRVSLIHQYKIRPSQTFPKNICLKQGHVFSTILFNIYINDLHGLLLKENSFFDTINDIPHLHDTKKKNSCFQMTWQFFHCQKRTYKKTSILEQFRNE